MRFSPLLLPLLPLLEPSHGFQPLPANRASTNSRSSRSAPPLALSYNLRDADMMESLVGGIRYEMVPLPDSMMDTTLFVGNLCEFCKDEDLSNLFQTVSTLQSVPACVVRKPNMSSLRYGFVTFLTAQEKETAIVRFHGRDFLGRSIKVEPIRDHPKMGRVKVPDRLVTYVLGVAKTKPKNSSTSNNSSSSSSNNISSLRSIAPRLDDTTKKEISLARKRFQEQQEQKSRLASQLSFPLNTVQQDELLRAARRGYLTLEGRTQSRARESNALACAHRQYCDEREQPQIVLCKAAGREGQRSPLDCLIVDLSPLRLTKAVGDDWVDDFMIKWKTQILTAAANAGMELRRDLREDNCQSLSVVEEEETVTDNEHCDYKDMDEGITEQIARSNNEFNEAPEEITTEAIMEYIITLTDDDSWATEPISRLPVVSMGIFEGERSNAKAMAKELADLWGIPREPLDDSFQEKKPVGDKKKADTKKQRGNKARRLRRNENKRERRNNQRDLDMYIR